MPQADSQTNAPSARRAELPLAGREMDLRDFTRVAAGAGDDKSPLATAKLVFSTGAAVRRYDWLRDRAYNEVLVVEEGSIRMDRLSRGAPLLNTHNSYELEAVLGVLENPSVKNGMGECDVTFSRRASVAGFVQDVDDRVIRNVSVGYVRHAVQMVPPEAEGAMWTYRVVDWEPFEVSLVPIPADMDSQVRSAGAPAQDEAHQLRTFPCHFTEVPHVQTRAAAHPPKATTMTEAELQAQREQEAATRAANEAAARTAAITAATEAATVRAAEITDLCARHNTGALAAALIRNPAVSVDQARSAVLEEIARRDVAAGGHLNVRVEKIGDETDTRMSGIEEAIHSRVDPKIKVGDNGRQYRGMSLLELGRDVLEAGGVSTRGLSRMALATQMLQFRSPGMHSTSDFVSLFSNVATKRLRAAYSQNPATYMAWARRAPGTIR